MKKARNIAYKIIIICLIGIIAVCGYQIFKTVKHYYDARIEYTRTAGDAGSGADPNAFTGEINWDSLTATNPDVKAWIYLKDTMINYPVVQGSDNSFYLHHTVDKKYNVSGTLFIDSNAPKDFTGFNTVIYGHHMKDGSMFRNLREYASADFYKKHKQFELITPTGKYHLQVAAFEEVSSTSEAYTYQFSGDAAKQSLIDFTNQNNRLDTGITLTTSDKLVTLSTCAYDFEGARFVVVTKMVPWTKSELAAAKKNEAAKKAAESGKSSSSSSKKSSLSFGDKVKLVWEILVESIKSSRS